MNGRRLLGLSVIAGLILSFVLGVTGAERNSLKHQIVGTWTLVDWEQVNPDGSTVQQTGARPKGVHVFSADGRFFALFARPEFSTVETTGSVNTLPDEKTIADGSVAYFGTYTVNDADRSVDLVIEVSTMPNELGRQQKRLITSVSAGELRYATPAVNGESTLVFKRAE